MHGNSADAGNDIIMPGNKNDDRSIREAYAEGKLTEEKIRECAGRIIALAEKLNKTELSYEGYELVWKTGSKTIRLIGMTGMWNFMNRAGLIMNYRNM